MINLATARLFMMTLIGKKIVAFTKCSQCGESFHLRLTSDQALNELHEKENNGEVLCLGCLKELKEYDVVQVVVKNPTIPDAKTGDKGAVLMGKQ